MKTIIAAIVIIIVAAVLALMALGLFCFYVAGEIMKGFEEWDGGVNDTKTEILVIPERKRL